MVKKILYIDIDGVLANISAAHSEYKKLYPEQPYPQSQYGFFMYMEPIDKAIETVIKLTEHFDVWFLTAPSFKNLLCYTEKAVWIKKYFGEALLEQMIICSNKSLCLGDYLIDDHNFGRGQDKFTGELIHFGSDSFKDWNVVYDYLVPRLSLNNSEAKLIKKELTYSHGTEYVYTYQLGMEKWVEDEKGEILLII